MNRSNAKKYNSNRTYFYTGVQNDNGVALDIFFRDLFALYVCHLSILPSHIWAHSHAV